MNLKISYVSLDFGQSNIVSLVRKNKNLISRQSPKYAGNIYSHALATTPPVREGFETRIDSRWPPVPKDYQEA